MVQHRIFSDTASTEQYVISGLDNNVAISIGGKIYWQVGLTNDLPS